MSFASEVKEELCDFPIKNSLVKMEFAGFLKFKGMLEIGEKTYFELTVKNICAARRVKNLLRIMHEGKVDVFYHEEKRLKAGRIFLFRINVDDIMDFLEKIGLSSTGKVKEGNFSDPAIFSAFLRGAFISSGSVADPTHHHHLEIYYRKPEILHIILKRLNDFFGIKGHIISVQYGYRFYIKNGAMIEEFLNFIGAKKSAWKIHNIMMESRIRSDVTRSMNFIEANSKRSGNATLKQINAIMNVDRELGLESLPFELFKVAKLRLENPELPLRELGALFDPPLSKSVVHRRLRKISEISKKNGDTK